MLRIALSLSLFALIGCGEKETQDPPDNSLFCAPTPFAQYLEVDKGRYDIEKLPARDDPMMSRIATIRERERERARERGGGGKLEGDELTWTVVFVHGSVHVHVHGVRERDVLEPDSRG